MTAKERIDWKEDDRRYRKVGRRYILCNDLDAYAGLEKGWWLVKVAEGVTSIRACVRPAKAELLAAAKDKEDELIEIIRKASEARPRSDIPISEQAKRDWEWFIARHGAEFNMLEYPSLQENAEKIIEALLEK
jgi:hypothetical protein